MNSQTNHLVILPLDRLVEAKGNPRKTFDPAAMDDLAASIKSRGVITPLIVRPLNNLFEIAAGHRRVRAAKMAGLTEVPVIVRAMTDEEFVEVLNVENLQRADIHPLEEAGGYRSLIDLWRKARSAKGGQEASREDVERVAQRVGKSAKYVYDRVKLLKLIPELQQIFLAGEITAGHAILLARLQPREQNRMLGKGTGCGLGVSGIFQSQYGSDGDLALEGAGPPLSRKAVSVRELDRWIKNHVRFVPSEVDLPNLFPETSVALERAAEKELKLVKITRDYRVSEDARDAKERTYGRQSWKRADGGEDGDGVWIKRHKSKTCQHAVMGVVVAGESRGEAFLVCVEKKKCGVHWAAEQKEAERGKTSGAGHRVAAEKREREAREWAERVEREKDERRRWKNAAPALSEALAEKFRATDGLKLVDVIREGVAGATKVTQLGRGETLEDAVRWLAFLHISRTIENEWALVRAGAKVLGRFGIDAKQIVSRVAGESGERKAPEQTSAKSSRESPKVKKANASRPAA